MNCCNVGSICSDYCYSKTSLEKEIEYEEEKLKQLNEEKELLNKLDALGIDLDVLKRLLKKER